MGSNPKKVQSSLDLNRQIPMDTIFFHRCMSDYEAQLKDVNLKTRLASFSRLRQGSAFSTESSKNGDRSHANPKTRVKPRKTLPPSNVDEFSSPLNTSPDANSKTDDETSAPEIPPKIPRNKKVSNKFLQEDKKQQSSRVLHSRNPTIADLGKKNSFSSDPPSPPSVSYRSPSQSFSVPSSSRAPPMPKVVGRRRRSSSIVSASTPPPPPPPS
mmetsp:Transcript_8856/g.14356  ORF Transcript_8856/g.14356 Transcript_8856/m.14356 type:complete len:213 (-) Transcript_8856:125-763(-)